MTIHLDLKCFGCDVVWTEPEEVTDETFVEIAAHHLTHGEEGAALAARILRFAARNTDEAREEEMERIQHALARIQ